MSETARASDSAGHRRHPKKTCLGVAGAIAAGLGAIVAFSGSPADAQPLPPPPPSPATVTVTVAPAAGAPAAIAPPAVAQTAPTPAVSAPLIPQVAAPPAPQVAAPPVPQVATPPAPQVAAPPAPQAAPTSPAPVAVPNLVPATAGTLTDFLKARNVVMEPQRPETFTALRFNLPMPRGWTRVPDPNVPDAFLVTADRVGGDGLYTSNAQLLVYRLIGDFDPKEAITHGFIDSQSQPFWQTTNATMGDFHGNPSSFITGTFRQNDMMLNTARRHVIVASGPDTYLVSLSVTTAVNQAVATGYATDAIVNGFQVSTPAPGPPPVPATPPAPAQPPGPPA